MPEYTVRLKRPHAKQREVLDSPAKRKVVRAGRRSGKTVGIASGAVQKFLAGRRVLYAAPTQEQVDTFWYEVKEALREPIDARVFRKDESTHMIELSHTKQRIRAKTAWDADTLRGDYADLLILDEFQLMAEDAWERVGQPMLIDNNGDAIFLYTPPSLHSRFRTRARDPRNASKLFLKATEDASGVWAAFHFTSHDNPHVSRDAIDRLAEDMTSYAYQQEILAEDRDEAPGALWTHALIEQTRRTTHPTLTRIVIGVDPPGGATECGIVVAGKGTDGHAYVLDDRSLKATPNEWAVAVISGYYHHKCDRVVGEKNYGGDMVQNTLRMVEGGRDISYHDVTSTRGKTLRAEPVAALNERGMIHHVGVFPALESEMCTWTSDMKGRSPNRMDASVFALTELMLHAVPIVVPISAASESRWRV